jgi:hypothetical protein
MNFGHYNIIAFVILVMLNYLLLVVWRPFVDYVQRYIIFVAEAILIGYPKYLHGISDVLSFSGQAFVNDSDIQLY